jgi:hypothetical protein
VIPNRTNAFNVETSISATSVGLYPVTATVHPNGKKTYYATVSSLAENSDVDWSVDEKIGGTIVKQANGTGIYTAPSNDGIFHVRATSKADASAYARALVYVTSVVSVSISPQSITMPTDGQCTFLATVVGTGNQELEWSTTGGKVTPAAGGKATYQAPMDPGTYEVTATSIADRTKMATATVTVAASGPKTLNFGGKVVTQLSPGIPINVTLIAEGTVIAPTGIGNNGELIEPKFSEGSAKSLGGLLQTPCKGTNKSATVSGSLSCALASTTYRNNGEPSDANYRVSNLSVRYEKCRTVGELPSGSHNFECTASAGLNATLYCGWSVWVQALVDVEEATYSKSNNREISRRKFTIPIPQGAGITIDPY